MWIAHNVTIKEICAAARQNFPQTMRFLLIGLAIVLVAILGLVFIFRLAIPSLLLNIPNLKITASTSLVASTTFPSVHQRASSSNPSAIPSGFHGPTSAPHVNGPTSNPPNY
jgi:hypothetical protein